jgi:hypothetical protein
LRFGSIKKSVHDKLFERFCQDSFLVHGLNATPVKSELFPKKFQMGLITVPHLVESGREKGVKALDFMLICL